MKGSTKKMQFQKEKIVLESYTFESQHGINAAEIERNFDIDDGLESMTTTNVMPSMFDNL